MLDVFFLGLCCTSDNTVCSRCGVSARLLLFSTVLVNEVFFPNRTVRLVEPPVRSIVGSPLTLIHSKFVNLLRDGYLKRRLEGYYQTLVPVTLGGDKNKLVMLKSCVGIISTTQKTLVC